MPTKTTSKTATRKSAAHKPAKSAATHKPAATKAKIAPKKKAEPEKKPARAHVATPAKAHHEPAAKVPAKPAAAKQHGPSVSLIDEKVRKESKDGHVRTKISHLPPISKILPTLEAPAPVKTEPSARVPAPAA